MNDFVNAVTCSEEEQKRETVKELVDNMDIILREIGKHVAVISDALYRGANHVEEDSANEPCATQPIVVIIRHQRDTAEQLLKDIIKIQEALW